MAVKLYFVEASPPCRAVNMVAHALDVPVEIVDVNLFEKEQYSPEFLKINPVHTIPVLEDNGFFINESHAICTYLISKYGKDDSLYPKDLKKRTIVDAQLYFNNDIFGIFKWITVALLFEKERDISQTKKDKLIDKLNILESIFEKQQYAAGNQLTVADICHIALVPSFSAYVPMPKDKYPNLHAWMDRCAKNIKDYKEICAVGCEKLNNIIADGLVAA